MDVRIKGNYEAWVLFFVEGVIESAKHALNTIDEMLDLREKNLKLLDNLQGKAKQTALLLYSYIQSNPIIDIKQTSLKIGKAFNTVSSAITTFIDLGILKQIDGNERYRVFAYEAYLDILRDGTL